MATLLRFRRRRCADFDDSSFFSVPLNANARESGAQRYTRTEAVPVQKKIGITVMRGGGRSWSVYILTSPVARLGHPEILPSRAWMSLEDEPSALWRACDGHSSTVFLSQLAAAFWCVRLWYLMGGHPMAVPRVCSGTLKPDTCDYPFGVGSIYTVRP